MIILCRLPNGIRRPAGPGDRVGTDGSRQETDARARAGPRPGPSSRRQKRKPERSGSEHAVVVGGGLRHVLDYVPVFDDLAVLQAEEVGQRSARVVRIARL
jgi:hypothetical protein